MYGINGTSPGYLDPDLGLEPGRENPPGFGSGRDIGSGRDGQRPPGIPPGWTEVSPGSQRDAKVPKFLFLEDFKIY